MILADSKSTFFQLFWTNQDFLFINFSVVFLLLIELILLNNNAFPKKALTIIMAIYGGVLIVLYTISSFADNITNYFTNDEIINLNKTFLGLTFLLGTIGFIYTFASKEREVSVE